MALEGVGEYDSCANPDVTYDKYGGLDSRLCGNDGKGAWNCHTLS